MKIRLLSMAAVLAMGLAHAASSYNVNLYRPTNINGTEFKAGALKVQVSGDKAIFKQGKTTAEAPVKVQNGSSKFGSTSVGYKAETSTIQEIRFGGTSTTLVLDSGSTLAEATK